MTLWLSPDARVAWAVPPSGRPGGQQRFANLAIETALTLRLVFRSPLRQTEGFVRSSLTVMRTNLDAPDHTTLSRRGQLLNVAVHKILATGPLHLIVGSTGLSVVGEGEWATAKHGGRGTRGWKKLHLGVDRSGMIVAHALTESTVDDATVGIALIGAAAGGIASVTADAAYDTVAFYEAASARHAQVVVRPTVTARVSRRKTRTPVDPLRGPPGGELALGDIRRPAHLVQDVRVPHLRGNRSHPPPRGPRPHHRDRWGCSVDAIAC